MAASPPPVTGSCLLRQAISVSSTSTRPASALRPGADDAAAQLGAQQRTPSCKGAESELALQLQRRDAVGMGRHQIGRPEPSGQRQLGVVHDRAGRDRGLLAAAGAFPSPRLGVQRHALLLPQPGQAKPPASAPRTGIRRTPPHPGSAARNSIKERGKSVICVTEGHHVREFVLS